MSFLNHKSKAGVIAATLLIGASNINPSVAAQKKAQKNDQRNILVILCDQLRPDFLNPYGFKAMKTPGVNRLAKMGVVFDNAITASPVCAPARASMMTGRYPSAHGVWSNDLPFNDGMEYFAERMNENGYITAAFGKMHHYPAADAKGFQIFIPMEESRLGEQEPYIHYIRGKYPNQKISRYSDLSKGYNFTKPKEDFYDYWNCSNTLEFLNEYEKGKYKGKPFMVWMSLQGPHTPYDPPKEMSGTVDASKLPEAIPSGSKDRPSVVKYRSFSSGVPKKSKEEIAAFRLAYAEKLKLEDEQIVRILDKLKESGMLENTTIIFSADHGDELGDFGLNQKGPFPYSHHLNIPMIIANHDQVKKGVRSDLLVSNIDIPGTCLDIAGDKKPLGLSRSMIDMLQPSSSLKRDVNFAEFCDSYKMVEDKHFRYSYFPFEQKAMLFNKKKDPNFQHDLAGKPKYASIELKFMKSLMDFQIVNKGIQIEAQDFITPIQEGATKIHPNWKNDGFIICYPLSYGKWKYLKEGGYDYQYNDFCIPKKVTRAYGPFWENDRYKKEIAK